MIISNKTVKTPAAASRRRALGDISNRKINQNPAKVTVQKRGISFGPSSSKKTASKPVIPPLLPSSVGSTFGMEEATATATVTSMTPKLVGPPVEDIEYRAGRPFDPFDGDDDSVNLSIDLDTSFQDSATPAPRSFLQQLDFEKTHGLNTCYDDDISLMVGSDGVFSELYRIDLSLEEEVDFLGLMMNDVSL